MGLQIITGKTEEIWKKRKASLTFPLKCDKIKKDFETKRGHCHVGNITTASGGGTPS